MANQRKADVIFGLESNMLPNAIQIKTNVSKYLAKANFAVHYEMGLVRFGRLRADVLALNMKQQFIIVEVKSSVQDFKSDHKWHKYRPFSHKFYFAMDQLVFDKVKSLIPSGTGVMIYQERRPYMRVVRKSTLIIPDSKVINDLTIRMAFRSADYTKYRR